MKSHSVHPLTYLACPYTHDDPVVREYRFQQANVTAAKLLHQGHIVFSPVSHSHPIALASNLPGDWEYWKPWCMAYLRLSKALFVLMLNGWKESVGIRAELQVAKDMEIPIEYLQCGFGQ